MNLEEVADLRRFYYLPLRPPDMDKTQTERRDNDIPSQ